VAEAQTSAAQAALAEARASASRAADELRRAESIKDTGALSAESIEARRTQAAAAKARERAAQAQLAEVNARLQGGYVRAPRAGLVIERSAQVGALVDGQALFRIAGGNALEVGVEVGENDMLSMRPGQRATFKMADGSDVQGALRRVPAAIDSKTRTGEAVFDLSGNSKLRAGMFLRGSAQLPPRPVLAAPQGAIKFEGEQTFVYVVGADNTVKRTRVDLGERAGGMIALRAGVEPGARIVAAGAAFLQDGDAINPVEAGANAAVNAKEPAPIRDRTGG
jgi:RND family efflux transporter MFP subunit